ncbi:Dna2/Cas4 domain-containing protein [Parabacteroides sp. 52]|uniref:UvrD-helicase domain-containing protein n=1 Tax=unclassified Parabacteroides TaxID=2649774 RepID=UPI0013D59C29|nr:UvrD-helicase domain-containing protein [Parabacteroides sp. PM5-20]MDH6534343.1 ATP-dependent helicase/nuclease subunit A [Parabacteroides sp. PM5-20]NDV54841.1 Dna2/Cas4 domain-containing protein [Parabacteroides sp. 52]
MLTIYRASAGAGKTHQLTGDYLKLLFARSGAYRRILAVTFTNKATDEMKSRIIEELYRLACGQDSGHMAMLCDTYTLTEESLRQEARKVMVAILHDYSAFNISTIDRFFQHTMRAFTREIGLQGGYGIEMDQELVLTEAVDNMLAGLDKTENKVLLSWLLRFAEEKIENGEEWNLRRDIMALGREVFKESFKTQSNQVSEDLTDKSVLEEYQKELYTLMQAVEKEAKALGEKGMELLSRAGLHPSDFKGGSRSAMLLLEKLAAGEMKEPTVTFQAMVDNVDACYTKTTAAEKAIAIIRVFDEGLNDCMKGIVTLFSNLTDYNTAKEITRYYYTLGILTDVSRHIAAYREEKNVMLIADTTELLNKVIDGSDAPFIYEKTGTRVDHYMIDEFQDTSGMQWHNFRPLLRESLAYKQSNLIVGDVKQSIYRFRNSDWKLLDEEVQKDFHATEVKEETLQENWRSCRSIVSFNNSLFTVAPELLQSLYNDLLETSSLPEEEKNIFSTRIASAYSGSYQKVALPFQNKEGHVKVEFIETEEEGKSWKEEALDRLPGLLEQLQDNGYELKDIAILVRTNLEGAQVADTLLTYKETHTDSLYKYDIVSDEALFISSSTAVRFIISLLRHLKTPEDPTCRQMAYFAYATLTGVFSQTREGFPTELQEKLEDLSHQSLYEMIEGIYRVFTDSFAANEQAFLQAFLDLTAEFAQRESPDLGRFLKWWDEAGYRKAIATPDEQNAVRILTVHKSKGLGMKVILVPFADWEIDHRPTKPVILWCEPKEVPFNKLRLVPVRYGKGLGNTRFATDYFNEKLYAYVDNLNTLYVAFTRAKEELLVLSPRPKKIKEQTGEVEKIDSIASLLWSSLVMSVDKTREGKSLDDLSASFEIKEGVFEKGTWWKPEKKKQEERGKEEIVIDRLTSVSPDERLQLRLYGKGFFFDNPLRKKGTVMHEVLSAVRTIDDVPAAVETYRLKGLLNREEANELVTQLQTLLTNPQVVSWYTAPIRVLNEVEILSGTKKPRRPDRVMLSGNKAIVVDYKFGEQEDKQYHNQVRNYLKLIQQMGYSQVEGYLWYVTLGKVERVKL